MNKAIFALAALTFSAQCFFSYAAIDQEVCYGDLGCFSTAEPFTAYGRVALVPDDPDDLDTKFMLYTRKNTDVPDQLKAKDLNALRNSHFNGKNPTKFIIHGWIDSPSLGKWMKQMALQFLMPEDCNAIVVDWRGGSQKLYGQSVANTRVVGAQIAQLVQYLKNQTGLDYAKVHILGHSLGSHVAGYAGERIPGLGRITGMDPADPYFQNMSTVVRLDESDAQFVDIVHTDAEQITTILNPFNNQNGMGLWQPSGHVDVYPNGGKKQPGCGDKGPINLVLSEGVVEGARYIVACAHMRAYEYVHQTIGADCPWRAYHCSNYDEFKTGRCLRCPTTGDKTKGCNALGTLASKPADGSVHNIYWLDTADKGLFCRYHFHIQLRISSDKSPGEQRGYVWVKLFGDRVETNFIQLGEDKIMMKPGATYDFLITTSEDISLVSSIELKWEHDADFLELGQIHVRKQAINPDSVLVFSGEFQKERKFCNENGELKSKDSRRLIKTC